jgi:hypothetical protein
MCGAVTGLLSKTSPASKFFEIYEQEGIIIKDSTEAELKSISVELSDVNVMELAAIKTVRAFHAYAEQREANILGESVVMLCRIIYTKFVVIMREISCLHAFAYGQTDTREHMDSNDLTCSYADWDKTFSDFSVINTKYGDLYTPNPNTLCLFLHLTKSIAKKLV